MDFLAFFTGRLVGRGVVRGLTGRVARRFIAEYEGVWAKDHEALHLDEYVRYADGRILERRWAVRELEPGVTEGHDALQHARLRALTRNGRTRLFFDRPRDAPPSPGVTQAVFDVEIASDDEVRLHGRTKVLGLTIARTEFVLRRVREA